MTKLAGTSSGSSPNSSPPVFGIRHSCFFRHSCFVIRHWGLGSLVQMNRAANSAAPLDLPGGCPTISPCPTSRLIEVSTMTRISGLIAAFCGCLCTAFCFAAALDSPGQEKKDEKKIEKKDDQKADKKDEKKTEKKDEKKDEKKVDEKKIE